MIVVELEVEDVETDKIVKVAKVTGSRGKSWIAIEDELLCDAWMVISQDIITGTKQTRNFY